MKDPLEPMSPRELKVLELTRSFEPPSGAEDRIFAALQASAAALPVPQTAPVAPVAPVAGVLGAKAVVAIAAAVLASGAGGVLLGRTVFAPAPPPPQVIEKTVRVEVPVPAPIAPPVVVPAPELRKPAPVARPEPKNPPAVADELLAQERVLIDTARSALLHNDPTAAQTALQSHAARFPRGRLSEERESLWVQALMASGFEAAARAKAARFHQEFPQSLLGPTVDAAISTP